MKSKKRKAGGVRARKKCLKKAKESKLIKIKIQHLPMY